MTNHRGGIPDLGAAKQMQRFGASLAGLPLHVNANGEVCDADGVGITAPQGVPIPRHHYLDADQLLHAVQAAVRHELRGFAVRLGRQDVADAMEADARAEQAALIEALAAAQAGAEVPDTEGLLA